MKSILKDKEKPLSKEMDSASSVKIKSNRVKMTKRDDNNILYANPAKPLDFSFKEIRILEDLRKMDPRSGIRRPVSEIEQEDADKNDNNFNSNKYDRPSNMGFNYEDDLMDRITEKKPKKEKEEQISEIKRSTERMYESNRIEKPDEEKSGPIKKKVKYLTYNNAVILHSNKIKSVVNIHNILGEILPEVSFLTGKNRSKIDLIQWIDISHNSLIEIHPDILNLPFLKILYCHANCIEEINGVSALSKSKSLLNLTLHGNPIEHIKGYRHYIIELIPSLEKLDYTLVSEKELDIIFHRGSRYGEKRDKTGKILSYPKIDDEVLKRMKKPKDDMGEKKDE